MPDTKWVYNGVEFNVGDEVQVVRKAADEEVNGMGEGIDWKACWDCFNKMDNFIGSTYTIQELNAYGAMGKAVDYFRFPLSSLKNLTKEKAIIDTFVAGDLAEVVDNSVGTGFTLGEVLRVADVADSLDKASGAYLYFDGKAGGGGMYAKRFKKVGHLPDTFKFHHTYTKPFLYIATKTENGYTVTWKNCDHRDAKYSVKDAIENVMNSTWTIIDQAVTEQVNSDQPTCNGFDADGNPKNFTADDLKPMMRFVTANGKKWIAVENVQNDSDCKDRFIGVDGGEWSDFVVDEKCVYSPVKVYAAPALNRDLLDVNRKGDLIWEKSSSFKQIPATKVASVADNTFKTRLAYFEASIAAVEEAAKENVKSLRDELVKLKGGF